MRKPRNPSNGNSTVIAWALDHGLESPMIDAWHAEELTLEIGGHGLAARWLRPHCNHDPRTQPTLVFLHEGLGSIAQWRDFPETLARRTGLAAFCYDRLGHGRSPGLTEARTMAYLEHEACQVLPSLLSAAGITHPILIGHSDGGTIALLFAANFPTLPHAVVTEAAHVFLEPITLQGLQAAREAYLNSTLRPKLERFHGNKVDALFYGWNDTWLHPASCQWDISDSLATLRAPLLMIQGAEDAYGSPAQLQAATARVAGPAEVLLIPECGHSPHSQAPAIVLDRMASFLGKFPAPR